MGESSRRGTRKQRISEAEVRTGELMPGIRKCIDCGADIKAFEKIDARSAHGIHEAYFGFCSECKFPFPLMRGEVTAVKKYSDKYMARILAQEQAIAQRTSDPDLTFDDEPESYAQRIERYRATFRAILKT